jgi:GAF domain-containing protein
MGEKRGATFPQALPLDVMAPSGVLGVLDDLSSMILGRMAIDRKLQAILETLSEHIDVDCARFVLNYRLARDGNSAVIAEGGWDRQLAATVKEYPLILESLASGTGTVVENGGTLGRSVRNSASESSLCVPVCRNGSIIGLLCVSTSRGRGSFSPWEVDFCSILANMAGAALTATC